MNNIDIVRAFIDAWNRMDWDAVEGLMAEDIFFHNIPMEPIRGRAAAGAFARRIGAAAVHWELLAIAADGNKVLTERVDNFDLANGKKLLVPFMGAFEIENGKIRTWRDYFDLAIFTSQML